MPWDSDDPVKAEFVGGSSIYDIAVLKVEGSKVLKECLCKQVNVAVSDEMAVGEACVAVGNSRGNDLRITTGVVSIEEMAFYAKADKSRIVTYINHTADTNSGNSGGGLFNSSGELIGIVNAKYNNVESDGTVTDNEIIQGMNYAIPSSIALAVAQNIIRNSGTLKRPEIGLELLTTYQWKDKTVDLDTETGRLRTTYTSYMRTNSGSFVQGDELLELSYTFEGRTVVAKITHINTIESHLYNLSVGDELTVKVKRGMITKSITVTIAEQSDIA